MLILTANLLKITIIQKKSQVLRNIVLSGSELLRTRALRLLDYRLNPCSYRMRLRQCYFSHFWFLIMSSNTCFFIFG